MYRNILCYYFPLITFFIQGNLFQYKRMYAAPHLASGGPNSSIQMPSSSSRNETKRPLESVFNCNDVEQRTRSEEEVGSNRHQLSVASTTSAYAMGISVCFRVSFQRIRPTPTQRPAIITDVGQNLLFLRGSGGGGVTPAEKRQTYAAARSFINEN